MSEFDDLLTSDMAWWQGFSSRLAALTDNASGQLAFWPVDDLVRPKNYLPCPRRGRHRALTECWLCFGDVAWGNATESEVLAPDADA